MYHAVSDASTFENPGRELEVLDRLQTAGTSLRYSDYRI